MIMLYDPVPEGIHRCRIGTARKVKTKSGNDAIRMLIVPCGFEVTIPHYVTFLRDDPEFASRQIREIFASAPSIDGEYELLRWYGAECACVIRHEDWNGKRVARVESFVPASFQDGLPEFCHDRSKIFVYVPVCGEVTH